MTIARRIFWTAALVVVATFSMNVYSKFVIQYQGNVAVDQLNGGDEEFGLALVASRDYSGYFIAFMALLVALLWIPVIYGAVRAKLSK